MRAPAVLVLPVGWILSSPRSDFIIKLNASMNPKQEPNCLHAERESNNRTTPAFRTNAIKQNSRMLTRR
uniref:Putative secreted peptide n=1 Tax=Anopheles braziliensis TaxID=58242 RepID=A0A2M3ZPZ2_9DIPT